MEASDEVAMFFVGQETARGSILKSAEIFKRIDQVTAEDILKVAKDIFKKEKLNLAIIGPHRNEAKLSKLLSI